MGIGTTYSLHYSPIADCGYPDPPVNGSFGGDITSTVEGSEITYQCNDGLTPEGNMTAVCGEDGEWRPNPGDAECRSTSEGSNDTNTCKCVCVWGGGGGGGGGGGDVECRKNDTLSTGKAYINWCVCM